MFLLPLVNVTQMRRRLLDYLPKMHGGEPGRLGELLFILLKPFLLLRYGFVLRGGQSILRGSLLRAGVEPGHMGSTTQQTCGICGTDAMLHPYMAQPCGHMFCYYCLRSHTEADTQYKCPLCLACVVAMQRVVHPLAASEDAVTIG